MSKPFRVHGGPYLNIEALRREHPGKSLGEALEAEMNQARNAAKGNGTTVAILGALALWFFAYGSEISRGWFIAAIVIGLVVAGCWVHAQFQVKDIDRKSGLN